jgi:hypothetical protein
MPAFTPASPKTWISAGLSANGRIQLNARGLSPRPGKGRRLGHLADRRDAGDRLLGELAERIGDRTDQTTVDVHGAAAHTGNHPRVGERPTLEPREDQVPAGADDVAEYTKDVDLEFLESGAFEYGLPDAHHSSSQFVDGKGAALGRKSGGQEQEQGKGRGERPDEHQLRLDVESTGKPLKPQGPARSALTAAEPLRYSQRSDFRFMPHLFSFVSSSSHASGWWWYPTATEGAASV